MEAWDAHVYFDGEDAASVEEALTLRYEVITSFPSLTVNRTRLSDPRGLADSDVSALPGPVLRSGPYRAPLGPHTTAMFSVELHTPVPTPHRHLL